MGKINLSYNYFKKMAEDDRFIRIFEDGVATTFICFSICNDCEDYEKKGLWEYLPHDPMGRICFVEKMGSFNWNKSIRKQLEIEIVKKYPNIEYAIWFRPTKNNDRKVIYKVKNETSLRN